MYFIEFLHTLYTVASLEEEKPNRLRIVVMLGW